MTAGGALAGTVYPALGGELGARFGRRIAVGALAGSVVVGTLANTFGWIVGYGAVIGLLACCLVALLVNRPFALGL